MNIRLMICVCAVFVLALMYSGDVFGDCYDPTADIAEPNNCIIPVGDTVDFDGSESSDGESYITTWAWDFGCGHSGTGETTSHTYDTTGKYTVTLTVTDNDDPNCCDGLTGCSDHSDDAEYEYITVVGVKEVVGDPNSNSGPLYVIAGTTVYLEAIPDPNTTTFPDGEPTWEITTQPAGSDPNLSSSGEYATFTSDPNASGEYVVEATCGTSNDSIILSTGCGGTYEIGVWRVFWTSIDSCLPVLCDGSDDDIKTDDCGNSLEIMCAQSDGTGGPLGCAYRYFYNDNLVSSCIWGAGANLFYYKYIEYDNGNNQYYKLKHSTLVVS